MEWQPETEESQALIQKSAKPLPPPKGRVGLWRRAFSATVGALWHLIKNYSADELQRLKEGGIQQVEGKGQTAIAEAKLKIAQAAEAQAREEQIRRHTEAQNELIKAQARKTNAEANKINAEAYKTAVEADAIKVKTARDQAIAEAMQNVKDAISLIKQKGGQVAFDSEQLRKLLPQGESESSDEPEPPSSEK